ncbi:hypothetical protein [Nocardioides antri]|uniref:Uncharacterized protein n=1 Tax=Nocardioides antri TaxID=2607659 RepID=A0A5B1M7S2_9ACTN|nr:hypothetical protein [Nocardioides antri]KAA1427790.1 hypothetical protein F0U47_10205 [Nocardioides antri]
MDSSSTALSPYCRRAPRDERVDIAPTREYRRDRQHLFALEDYQSALAAGGIVRSYCGIDELVRQGDPDCLAEVFAAEDQDCVTCLDIWRGQA